VEIITYERILKEVILKEKIKMMSLKKFLNSNPFSILIKADMDDI
jgi:hypothetical protein